MRDRILVRSGLAALASIAIAMAARDAAAVPPTLAPPIESGGSLVGSATGTPGFEHLLNSPAQSTFFSDFENNAVVNAYSAVEALGGSVPIVSASSAADDGDTSLDFGAHATTTAYLNYYFYIGPVGPGPPIPQGTLVPIVFTYQMDVSPGANVVTEDAVARGSASLFLQDPATLQTYLDDEIDADWLNGPTTASSGGPTPLLVPFDTYLTVSLFVTAETAVARFTATPGPELHASATARIDPSIAIDANYQYANQLEVVQTTVPEPAPVLELESAAVALFAVARRRKAA